MPKVLWQRPTELAQQLCSNSRSAVAPDFVVQRALPLRQVDQWLDFAPQLVPGAGFTAPCEAANEALTLRTFLAGHSLTVADVAVWGQLKSALTPRRTDAVQGSAQLSSIHSRRKPLYSPYP